MSHVLTKNPNLVTRQSFATSSGLPPSFLHRGHVCSRHQFDRFDGPCHGSCFLYLVKWVLRLLIVFPFEIIKELGMARTLECLTGKLDFGGTSHVCSASHRFTIFPSGLYFCIYSQRRLYRIDLGIIIWYSPLL